MSSLVPLDSPSTTCHIVDLLQKRRSTRDFAPAALPRAALADLLWAAQGVVADGRRTTPVSMNVASVVVLVAWSYSRPATICSVYWRSAFRCPKTARSLPYKK